MNEVAYLAAAVLAAVFVWAAGTKLARPQSTAADFRALAVPSPELSARAIPLVELAVAAALLALPPVGGALALVTLAAFSQLLFRRIRAGAVAPCACFGTARRDPVSYVELVRNALLAVLAVVALFAPDPALPSLEATITVSAALVAGVLVLDLVRLRHQVGAVWSNSEAREGVRP